jgi:hypothetical protein
MITNKKRKLRNAEQNKKKINSEQGKQRSNLHKKRLPKDKQ